MKEEEEHDAVAEAEDFYTKQRLDKFYKNYAADRGYNTGKYRFLLICQILLLWFLGAETMTNEDMIAGFEQPAESMRIVLARFLCAVILHITLTDEIKQGFNCMKYALSHHYKFRDWTQAYWIGCIQTLVVIAVEVVNLAVLTTNHTIMDIIMNFLALVIIAEFDDFFFMTVDKELMGDFI